MPSNIFGWKNYMYFFGGSQPAFHFLNRCSSRKCGEPTFITTHPNPCPPGAAARTAETLCVVTVKVRNKTETFPDSIPMKSWVFIEIPGMEKKTRLISRNPLVTLDHSGRSQYSKPPSLSHRSNCLTKQSHGTCKVPHRESPEARPPFSRVPQPPILFPYPLPGIRSPWFVWEWYGRRTWGGPTNWESLEKSKRMKSCNQPA